MYNADNMRRIEQAESAQEDTLPKGAVRLPSVAFRNERREELLALLDTKYKGHQGYELTMWCWTILRSAPISKEPQVIELMSLDSSAMELPESYPRRLAWEKAAELGDKVSVQAFAHLAMEVAKGNVQVEVGKPLAAFMDPITVSLNNPSVLYIKRNVDSLMFGTLSVNPHDYWSGHRLVVSVRK